MKSKLKKIIILFIGLVISFSLNNTLIDNKEVQNQLDISEQSAGYIESFIHIDGSIPNNWSWTAGNYSWCDGDGSWGNRYTIENVTIDCGSTGSGIFIINSLDVYFSIRNSTIYGSGSGGYDAGIKLVNVTNGKIVNNTCSNNLNDGILLMTDCYNNTIANNVANDNGDTGIYLLNNCYENIIANNTVNNNDYGIVLIGTSGLIGCDHNNISNNTAINNGVGIHLSQSDFNTVYGNRLVDNSKITFGSTAGNGIRITYYNWGGRSINNTIENNQILSCRYGIFMYDGVSNKILNNTVNNNTLNGMYIRATNFPCVNNTIENNTINYNQQHGIYLVNSDYSNITNNTINENNQHGIYFSNSDDSDITDNTINDNTDIGICLRSSSDNNVIKNNTINRNDLGITLDHSDNNNISGNTLKDNNWCIYESYSVGNIIEYNDCSPPTVQEPIFINDAATGVGAHNWTWAVSQSWCLGSGNWDDPYILDHLSINGFGLFNGIEIWNSNVSFIIQDCLIYNSDTGIYLENVNNSRLINNNCSNNSGQGIYIEYSNNNTISGNTANGNNYEGIYLYECDDSYITGNTVNDNSDGIYIDTSCDNNLIEENTANDNNRAGIYLTDSDYNNITGNTASGSNNGIFLEDLNYNNIITGNSFNNNDIGIEIFYSDFNSITENDASHSVNYGIRLEGSSNNTVNGNTACNSTYTGIYLSNNCENNTISGNIANDNDNYGMYLDDCDNNTISGNIANGNGFVGIHLNAECDNNTISGNTVNNNDHSGIYFDGNDKYNVISGNTASNNTYTGIHLESANNDYNTISGNTLSDSMYGINIGNSDNNTIYGNFFLANGIHAMDNGTDNKWNSTTIGNYWDNWTSPDTNPQDGIVDDPYTYISGSTGGTDYLPIAEDGAPSITINSPSDDDVFGFNAPNYDVTITDDYLFEMWYTLDGGLHNYTITEVTGTIEQSAWESLSDGTITLTFYASDIPGNIDSADLNIVKDATGPIIVVNSPSSGNEFGVSAPAFNITITDDHLDSVWYSLDGGLTTYAITTNATVDQTAWAALSEGLITITFYANDTLGNEESEEIIIAKTLPPDGDDPTIVIVIVLVSIVGGVVVLTGVYLFMKKRAITE